MQKYLIAIRLHQCFKMVLYPNEIGLVQKYKAGLKLEKKCLLHYNVNFINSIKVAGKTISWICGEENHIIVNIQSGENQQIRKR